MTEKKYVISKEFQSELMVRLRSFLESVSEESILGVSFQEITALDGNPSFKLEIVLDRPEVSGSDVGGDVV